MPRRSALARAIASRLSARSTATTLPLGPTRSAAGIADAPDPAQASRTIAPGCSSSRSTVARPNRSQKLNAGSSNDSAAALYVSCARRFASSTAAAPQKAR